MRTRRVYSQDSASEVKEWYDMRSMLTGYSHRHNDDGTYDAICLRCFRTVAHRPDEQELKAFEATHDCDKLEREEVASVFPQ